MEGRGSIKIQREPQYIKVFSSYVRANKRKQVKIVSTVHFMSPNISKMLSFQQVINKNYWDILVFFFFFGDVFELRHAYHTFTAHLSWDEPCFKHSGAT